MKRSNLTAGILYMLAGVLLAAAAFQTNGELSSLLFGFGGAGIGGGIALIGKYCYWNLPKNRERYEERLEHERIEMQDELKSRLRDRSGRCAYQWGLLVISVSMVVFSILGALDVIPESRLIVLYLGAYLVFQIVMGIAVFRRLLKRY